MISKHNVMFALRESGVVTVIRTEKPNDMVDICRALYKGGIKFVEITMTVPDALDIIHEAALKLKDLEIYLGAGTVLDSETARLAILAGSKFVVGPAFNEGVVRICNSYDVAVMPGALTPNEVFTAWKKGADVVKIFPGDIGGPDYIKALKEPLPQVKLLPTKGVNYETASAFIKAGAIAVGTGSAIVSKELMIKKDYAQITENAAKFVKIIKEAQEGV